MKSAHWALVAVIVAVVIFLRLQYLYICVCTVPLSVTRWWRCPDTTEGGDLHCRADVGCGWSRKQAIFYLRFTRHRHRHIHIHAYVQTSVCTLPSIHPLLMNQQDCCRIRESGGRDGADANERHSALSN